MIALEYNSFDLASIGELTVTRASDFEGALAEAPQREKVTVTVKVTLFEASLADNYAQFRKLADALNTQQATLKWYDSATGAVLLEQTAALTGQDLPENEVGWNEMLEINLSFVFYNQSLVTNLMPATFLKTGSAGTSVSLGSIGKWAEGYTTERYSPRHSQRAHTGGRIEASGLLMVDTTADLAGRRADLLALKTKLVNEVNANEGTLVFGDFSRIVRVSEFKADVDAATNAIAWTLSATWTRFPNEADYALVEFTAEQRDTQTGEQTLSLAGKISAPDEAKARTKLASVKTALIAQYGYDTGQLMRDDSTPQAVSADADGDAFLELMFNVEVRRWRADNITCSYTPSGKEAVALGNVSRWNEEYNATRFSELRDQRSRAGSVVTASGTLKGNMAQDLDARRTALIAEKDKLMLAMNSPKGALVYGTFNQTVRVERFTAEVNQAITGIDWSVTCARTVFPDETNYAIAEFQVATRQPQNGEILFTLTGRVQSHSEAGAQAKLDAIRSAVLAQNTGAQTLRVESQVNKVAADADGEAFIEITFTEEYRRFDANNQGATLDDLSLGQVMKWSDRLASERYSRMRSQRKRTECVLNAGGTLLSTEAANGSVTARRAELLKLARQLKVAANKKENRLVFGDFTQVVRMDDFTAEINQAINGIDWTLTANYTLSPDETNYALVEFSADTREEYSGEQFLNFHGRIEAPTEAQALVKLASLRNSVLTARGFVQAQPLRAEVTPSTVDADIDGQTFTALDFQEEYRRWRSDNMSATFTKTGASATSLGNVHRWAEGYAAERPAAMRSQRNRALGRVTAGGTLSGDATTDVASRRAALLVLKDNLIASVNGADGTLVFGTFNKIVRVTEANFEINQAINAIDWTLTAEFDRFPSPADYATAEFSASVKDDQTGELILTFTGRVMSSGDTAARNRLASLRDVVLTQRGFKPAGQALRQDESISYLYANGDRTAGLDTTDTTFLELSFNEEYRGFRSDNLTATFAGKSLGQVRRWNSRYNAARFSELHSQRSHAAGMVEAAGTFTPVDGFAPVATRRTALLALAADLRSAINGKDGALVYGAGGEAFNKTVRVTDANFEVNQALTGIDWTLSATWSEFPNESGYALAELEVQQRSNVEDLEQFLTFNGRIQAPDEAAARAKLVTLRTAMLTSYSFDLKQQLRVDSTARTVNADTDGTAFTELQFSEEYRKRVATGVSYTVQSSDREDFRSGIIVTTISGVVTAGAATPSDAYAAALAKAEALGKDKYDFILASTVTFDERQTTSSNDVEFVRLSFSYEYQRRDVSLTFLEMSSETMSETFGLDTEQVNGSVAAADYATALAFYNTNVKALFTGRLVRNERVTEASQREVRAAGDTSFFVRLDFTLQAHVPKPAGAVKLVLALDTTKKFQALQKETTVSGSVYASSEAEANTFLDGYLGTLQLGVPVPTESRRKVDSEYNGTTWFMKLDFNESYVDRLTGFAALVECECTEDVQYSGTRWVEQEVPDDFSVIQDCGITCGKRTVRATATASTQVVAEEWCNRQRAILTRTYEEGVQRTVDYVFVPLTDGIVIGSGANFKATRVTLVFSELLPNEAYTFTSQQARAAKRSTTIAVDLTGLGYVQNESTGLWHRMRARNNIDGVLEEYLDPIGITEPPPPGIAADRTGYVQNESTGLWHKIRARNNVDNEVEEYLDPAGVL